MAQVQSNLDSRGLPESRLEDELLARFGDEPMMPWMLASAAVMMSYKLISRRAEAVFKPLGLSMSRYEILGLLDRGPTGGMSVGELKRMTLLQPPTLTSTLDWLEQRGLTFRAAHATDRRKVMVQITQDGRDMCKRASDALGTIHFGLPNVDRGTAIAVAQILALTHGS